MENPPAFPNTGNKGIKPTPGMTLRDWFAGQALAGLCANRGFQNAVSWHETPNSITADTAFALADTMLAARTQEHTPC